MGGRLRAVSTPRFGEEGDQLRERAPAMSFYGVSPVIPGSTESADRIIREQSRQTETVATLTDQLRDCRNSFRRAAEEGKMGISEQLEANQLLRETSDMIDQYKTGRRSDLRTKKESSMNRSTELMTSQEDRFRSMQQEIGQLRDEMSRNATTTVPVVLPSAKKVRNFWGSPDKDSDLTVEDFIDEMKWALRSNNHRGLDAARFVVSHLRGDARSEVKNCGAVWHSEEGVFEILTDAFGERRTLPTLLSEFAQRRQQPNEGIRVYATDLYERFAYLQKAQRRAGRTVSPQEVLIDQFIEGLRDRNLVIELRRGRDADFLTVRKKALEWEEIQRPVSKSSRTSARVQVTEAEQSVEKELQALRERNRELVEEGQKMRKEFREMKEKLSQLQKQLGNRTNTGSRDRLSGNVPSGTASVSKKSGANTPGGQRVCYQCQSPGSQSQGHDYGDSHRG